MIVDANVVVSASLGRSLTLVMSIVENEGTLLVPEHQMREAKLVTTSHALRSGRDPAVLLGWIDTALVAVPADLYEGYEAEARARLQHSGQKDWPLVALALASREAVWSNDVDLFGTGVVTWNTHNVRRARQETPDSPLEDGN